MYMWSSNVVYNVVIHNVVYKGRCVQEKKCGSQKKYFPASFWQSINIVNIMGGFGRYDHVTKRLIVFSHKSISGN